MSSKKTAKTLWKLPFNRSWQSNFNQQAQHINKRKWRFLFYCRIWHVLLKILKRNITQVLHKPWLNRYTFDLPIIFTYPIFHLWVIFSGGSQFFSYNCNPCGSAFDCQNLSINEYIYSFLLRIWSFLKSLIPFDPLIDVIIGYRIASGFTPWMWGLHLWCPWYCSKHSNSSSSSGSTSFFWFPIILYWFFIKFRHKGWLKSNVTFSLFNVWLHTCVSVVSECSTNEIVSIFRAITESHVMYWHY